MKTTKAKNKEKTKIQVGLRLDAELVKPMLEYAQREERTLSWVLTRVIRIGLPAFLDINRAA